MLGYPPTKAPEHHFPHQRGGKKRKDSLRVSAICSGKVANFPFRTFKKMSNFTVSMRNHSKFPPHSPPSHPRQACKSSDLDLHIFWCIWVLMSGLVTGPLFTAQVYGLRCTSQNPMSIHKSQELHGCNMSLSCPQASSSRRPLDP